MKKTIMSIGAGFVLGTVTAFIIVMNWTEPVTLDQDIRIWNAYTQAPTPIAAVSKGARVRRDKIGGFISLRFYLSHNTVTPVKASDTLYTDDNPEK